MSFLRLRRKGASKVYQAQQSSAPGSQVVQQRLEIDTLKQAPEESVRQKEREWQQERAELLALIKQLNEKLYDQENRHANSIHQVKTDLLIEKGFHASKQSQYLREKAKI
jgi:vacuolar-type H+-ATPase subunit I/STV1